MSCDVWRWDTEHFTFDDDVAHTMDGWHFVLHVPDQDPNWVPITNSPDVWTEIEPAPTAKWTGINPDNDPNWTVGTPETCIDN